jgi:glycosyltransferase involved in cell wall biosynthesis
LPPSVSDPGFEPDSVGRRPAHRRDVEGAGAALASPRLFGVLVTYNRPVALAEMLSSLRRQTRPLDHLTVVDNSPTGRTRDWTGTETVDYLPQPENVGPAGAIAVGCSHALETAHDGDWLLILDDGDPPATDTVIQQLFEFAQQQLERDPRTAAVGLGGSRFDRRRGRVVRPSNHELTGPVAVDWMPGGLFPLYRAGVVRRVGATRPELFFGMDDLDWGLRLRAAGWSLYSHGPLRLESRKRFDRLNLAAKPALGMTTSWRDYYSLRNTIDILRSQGLPRAALKVTLLAGFAKPGANLVIRGPRASVGARLRWRACSDGWLGRLGRRLEPDR